MSKRSDGAQLGVLRLFLGIAGPALLLAVTGGAATAVAGAVANRYLATGDLFLAIDLVRAGLERGLLAALAAVALLTPVAHLLLRRGFRAAPILCLFIGCALLPVALGLAFADEWVVSQDQLRGRILPRFFLQRRELLLTLAALTGCAAAWTAWYGRPGSKPGPEPSRRFTVLVIGLGWAGATLALASWLSVHVALATHRTPLPPRPHSVVYVTWDSTRADHLSSYGHPHPTTPHVDAFAAEGLLFERAVSQNNWTLPSYASILTSQSFWRLDGNGIPPRRATLAEILKSRGYRTIAYVQNPQLDSRQGFAQGFDEYVHLYGDVTANEMNRHVLPRVRSLAGSGKPFFLFLHYMQPHWPYPPVEAEGAGRGAAMSPADIRELMARNGEGWDAGAADAGEKLAYLHRAYDEDLRATDSAFGEILAALRGADLYGESLMVFNSDHGEEFYEHGAFGHAHDNLHPELTFVPLIVRFPDAMAVPPGRVRAVVRNLDLVPTVLHVLGIDPPADLEGESLIPLEPLLRRPRLAVSNRGAVASFRIGERAAHVDFRLGDAFRFYDLSADPDERSPIARPDPGFDALVRSARQWFADYAEAQPESTAPVPSHADEDLLERLRALGYAR